MRLLDKNIQYRYDTNSPVVSPNIYTGVFPRKIKGKKVEAINVFPFSISTQTKNPDAITVGLPREEAQYVFGNEIIKAHGIFKKPYNGTPNSFLNGRYTGELVNSYDATIYETCHGVSSGNAYPYFNYYLGFHPFGYFSPPFGEIASLSEYSDIYSVVGQELENGSCANITNDEYMQMRGIVTVSTSDSINLNPVNVDTNRIRPKINPLYSPYEECPPEIQPAYYFEEILFQYTAGTYDGGVVGNPFNHNPIPSALDFSEMTLTNRYNLKEVPAAPKTLTYIAEKNGKISESMTLIANYGTGTSATNYGMNDDLSINNRLAYRNLCLASSMEGGTSAGVYQGGSLDLIEYEPASPTNAASIVPTFNYNPWYFWNFTFKENHDQLPFLNNFNPKVNSRNTSRGTTLLDAKKADVDHWWENRQCPEVVDFLTHTIGATIYDCPRDYFEIPYYSAIGKFGYFGARFQASCKTLQRTDSNDKNDIKGGIPVFEKPFPMTSAEGLFDVSVEIEGGGAITDFYYNGLLTTADREQKYAEWFYTNKAVPLSYNYSGIINDWVYEDLITGQPRIAALFYDLSMKVSGAMGNLPNFILGGDKPHILVDGSFEEDYSYYDNKTSSNIRLDGYEFSHFLQTVNDLLTPAEKTSFDTLMDRYGYFFKKDEAVHWEAYQSGISGREERFRTRALLNLSQGNPIDLFPSNHIYYSFDNKTGYKYSDKWASLFVGSVSTPSLNGGLELPKVDRRYFEGTFTKASDYERIRGKLTDMIAVVDLGDVFDANQNLNFTDGGYYKNIHCGAMLSRPHYYPVTGGNGIKDSENPHAIGLANNWMMLGFNEIGKIDTNFSCFAPIFVQQPKNVYCKIGQTPTMRASALDYHTIPEDKIKVKHSEIWYWANKLKLCDNNHNYLYPMRYSWARVKILNLTNFMQGRFEENIIEWAGHGDHTWGTLEGDNAANATLIHPKECVSASNTAGYNGPNKNDYAFLQGIKIEDCTEYAYFCMAAGRFGTRFSDPFFIEADEFTSFDIAYMNGGGANILPALTLVLESTVNNSLAGGTQVGSSVGFSPTLVTDTRYAGLPYNGIKGDKYIIPEEVVAKRRFIRVGGGQNVAVGFKGDFQFRGFVRSYAPETFDDQRGLKATNHQPVDYGILLNYKLDLTDYIGACLYGYSHLPVCSDYQMSQGQAGIKTFVSIDGKALVHRDVTSKAEIGLGSPAPVIPNPNRGNVLVPNIQHLGQLYNFEKNSPFGVSTTWQFHQNLGAVKRFGKSSTFNHTLYNEDYTFVGFRDSLIKVFYGNKTSAEEAFNYVQNEVLTSSDLAGINCGYEPRSVGRKMLYFVEAFERFYTMCNSKSKFNVTNRTFVAPGLRYGDAPMQYTWIGQPSDTYLERRPMYGPYAFQWKVHRHNRDRLGNGISQGLWSMGWRDKYSLMYDIPAVYGLYCKNTTDSTKRTVQEINLLRKTAFPNSFALRNLLLGRRGTRSEGYGYGDIRINCEEEMGGATIAMILANPSAYVGSNAAKCAYYQLGSSQLIKGAEYYCGLSHIQGGVCFDPCLSLRYSHGFIPGGKLIGHMSAGASEDPDGGGYKYVHRITSQGEHIGMGLISEIHAGANTDAFVLSAAGDGVSVALRGPASTPYARGIRDGSLKIATPFSSFSPEVDDLVRAKSKSNRISWSIDPCEPGGSEHCNFTTPTIHVGGTLPLTCDVNYLTSNNNQIYSAL